MEATAKHSNIIFIIECLNSDLHSYKEYIDDMVEKEGGVYSFLNKNESSFNEWLDWFNGI